MTAECLYNAILRVEADAMQMVYILTGAGSTTFCAEAFLHQMIRSMMISRASDDLQAVNGYSLGPICPSRLIVQKPAIRAIIGHAVTGGLKLSLLADLRVFEKDTVFDVVCRRWGAPLSDRAIVRLQAIVSLGRTMGMILTGRPVGAQEALAVGLASCVISKESR
ncbi:uncharacterized protein N7503_006102 [Penicillium pulvis]|uniref:uncharacterized protein n=1 Tax=Penicillium pulvis TaxID=1562058 RepID=UPI002548AA9D|nr:uncharacterized protein N7503_006102 [Penicillium pulvis]KAJ5803652.1 hypothetical protein N7503_006102 [Penicillium pulvis]